MAKKSIEYVSLSNFFLEVPLYLELTFPENGKGLYELYGSSTDSSITESGDLRIDGYCHFCQMETTFKLEPQQIAGGDPWRNLPNRYAFDTFELKCLRKKHVQYKYYVLKHKNTVTKIGQFPSLADIAIGEIQTKYKTVLKGANWQELYKAIGLAAHGEGIASSRRH